MVSCRRLAVPIALVAALCVPGSAVAQGDDPAEPQIRIGEGGLRVTSADDRFGVRLGGYMQVTGRFFVGDEDERSRDNITLRRLRPDLRWTAGEYFTGRMQMDFAGDRASVYDAYIDFTPLDALSLRVGKHKVPLGLEQLQSPPYTAFVERSLATLLVPNRDFGVTLRGSLVGGRLGYQVGVFDGTADNTNGDGNVEDEAFELAGRLWTRPLAGAGTIADALEVGVAATWSSGEDDAGARALAPRYRTAGRWAFFTYGDDVQAARGDVWRATAHAYAPVGRTYALLEYVASHAQAGAPDETAGLTHTAWNVTVGHVFGGSPTFTGSVPDAPYPAGAGAFEIKARATGLQIDADAFDGFAADGAAESALEIAGGATWWVGRTARWMVDVHHTRFEAPNGGGDISPESAIITTLQVGL